MPAAPPQQFAVPHGIAGSRDGHIYLADRANNRIQVFRQNGEFVREKICGRAAGRKRRRRRRRSGRVERRRRLGRLLARCAAEYLYVADGGTRVITVLRRSDLEVVSEFGGPGVGPGQRAGRTTCAVDPSGNIFVAEAAGPKVKHPQTGAEVDAGFRAQEFTSPGPTGEVSRPAGGGAS